MKHGLVIWTSYSLEDLMAFLLMPLSDWLRKEEKEILRIRFMTCLLSMTQLLKSRLYDEHTKPLLTVITVEALPVSWHSRTCRSDQYWIRAKLLTHEQNDLHRSTYRKPQVCFSLIAVRQCSLFPALCQKRSLLTPCWVNLWAQIILFKQERKNLSRKARTQD